MKKYLIIIIALSFIALWPFFRKGYFESHDGEWMVIRFTAFHQALSSGQFPVRFVDRLNNNYGYPVLNFLYPLPFYLAEIPKILGFSFVDDIKIIFVLSSVLSVIAMFWALSCVFDKKAAMAGSILYLFTPYRFVDLYVRGSLGESLAFAFVPIVAGSLFKIAKGQKIFQPILAISIALLILSHNVIAILFLPFFLILSFVLSKKHLSQILASFLLGIFIAAFFWFPAIYDLRYVRLSQIKVSQIADHLVDLQKLIIPQWGYGPNPNGFNPLPIQIGIIPLFIIASAVYIRIFTKGAKNIMVEIMLLIFFAIAILMTKISLPFWQIIPKIDVIQFPWRLLSVIVFIVSFLTAYVLDASKKNNTLIMIVVAASITSTIVYTKPKAFVNHGEGFYTTNEDSTTVRDEYLPLWVQEKSKERANQKIETKGRGQIISSIIKPADYQVKIKSDKEINVQVNSIYFPGWQVKVDNKVMPIDYQNKFGLITFKLPEGEHEAIIKYTRTPVHLAGEFVSVLALIFTGTYFFILWKKQNF